MKECSVGNACIILDGFNNESLQYKDLILDGFNNEILQDKDLH